MLRNFLFIVFFPLPSPAVDESVKWASVGLKQGKLNYPKIVSMNLPSAFAVGYCRRVHSQNQHKLLRLLLQYRKKEIVLVLVFTAAAKILYVYKKKAQYICVCVMIFLSG